MKGFGRCVAAAFIIVASYTSSASTTVSEDHSRPLATKASLGHGCERGKRIL